jgi:hypothetical protein
MKTIQQRLQSRIAKRRNFIRFVEDDMAGNKESRAAVRALDLGFDHVCDSLTVKIAEQRRTIKILAEDQKLDKALSRIVLGVNQNRRYYGLSDY